MSILNSTLSTLHIVFGIGCCLYFCMAGPFGIWLLIVVVWGHAIFGELVHYFKGWIYLKWFYLLHFSMVLRTLLPLPLEFAVSNFVDVQNSFVIVGWSASVGITGAVCCLCYRWRDSLSVWQLLSFWWCQSKHVEDSYSYWHSWTCKMLMK